MRETDLSKSFIITYSNILPCSMVPLDRYYIGAFIKPSFSCYNNPQRIELLNSYLTLQEN